MLAKVWRRWAHALYYMPLAHAAWQGSTAAGLEEAVRCSWRVASQAGFNASHPRHNAAAAGDVSLLATRLLALGRADHPDISARDYDGSTVTPTLPEPEPEPEPQPQP